jgi:hypothetical protein
MSKEILYPQIQGVTPAHTGGETRLSSLSTPAYTMKILEAEQWLKGADLHEAALLQRQKEQGGAGAPHPGLKRRKGAMHEGRTKAWPLPRGSILLL